MSLGTIDDKSYSWNFLLQGFDILKLKHPVLEFNKKYKGVTEKDVEDCRLACYEAADGLLKSLNELGRAIAKSATVNRRVSKASILMVSRELLERNIKRFNNDYPVLSKLIQKSPFVKDIVTYLFDKGIGRIHNWYDVLDSFKVETDECQIENAIRELVEVDFITRTGYDGEVLFVTNPTLAHTLGAVISNPDKYRVPRAFLLENKQYVLPLMNKNDNGY